MRYSVSMTLTDDFIEVEVPGTNGQLSVRSVDRSGEFGPVDYWRFVATRSGKVIEVEYTDPFDHGDGRYQTISQQCPSSLAQALSVALDLYHAAVAAGLPLHEDDPAELRRMLANLSFFDTGSGVVCRRSRLPEPPKRKITQKRLDGGEDITV